MVVNTVACCAVAWKALGLHSVPASPETVKGILYLVRNCHILMEFCNRAIKCQRKKELGCGSLCN